VVRAGSRRDTTEVFGYMKAQEDRHTIATMSRVLEVSRSGFYAWTGRRPSQRAREDSELSQRIQNIHEESRGTYGALRI
jgi:putative transposase